MSSYGRSRRNSKGGILAVLLTGVLALTGCSHGSGDDAARAAQRNIHERGPITFAMGKNDIANLRPVVDRWNKDHPSENVTLHELAGEADSQRDTLVQSLQARSGEFDVIALDVIDTASFAAHQWLQPLTGDMAVDMTHLLPATVESATYAGTVYAAPQNTNGQLLFYRSDLIKHPPHTWRELTQDCAIATRHKLDCLVSQLKQYEGLTVNTSMFINGWGGQIVGADGFTPTVTSDPAREGIQTLVDAYKDGVFPKRVVSFTEEETNLAFVNGEALFAINWPYMYENAGTSDDSKVKGKFAVAPLVGKDGVGASTLGGYNNAINVYSEHKATARDFIAFGENRENQLGFAQNSFPPVLTSIYDDKDLIKEHPYLPILKTSLENAVPRPVSPFYPAISKAIQDNVYAALSGRKTVVQATKDMTSAIEVAEH